MLRSTQVKLAQRPDEVKKWTAQKTNGPPERFSDEPLCFTVKETA